MVPLIDMGAGTYHGFEGGLYPGGINVPPASHSQVGLLQSSRVEPRDTNGTPDPSGKIVFLSIGMSNAQQFFCGNKALPPDCDAESFMGKALLDPQVNNSDMIMINGAAGNAIAAAWASPSAPLYNEIRDDSLFYYGLSEAQVQVVWILVANLTPSVSLPEMNADVFFLESHLGNIMRTLRTRYPNLAQVFVASRTYAGYATKNLNPEPYAYEMGFAVKWLIEAQIEQMSGAEIDPIAGDLTYNLAAPWLAWDSYAWANGSTPNSEGLFWLLEDFIEDGTHPSLLGVDKRSERMVDFFKSSPFTTCWFLSTPVCPDLTQVFLPAVAEE